MKNENFLKQQGYTKLGCPCLSLKEGIFVYGGARMGKLQVSLFISDRMNEINIY